MSRIGNRELVIPTNVSVIVENNNVIVKGPKGELKLAYDKCLDVQVNDNIVTVKRANDIKTTKQLHGTINSLIENMIKGVSEGYEKSLEMVGVGYRFQMKGANIVINAGYSHPVEITVPTGITVEIPSNTEMTIRGIDKCLVGEFAANIRKVRRPEPYKGKGIRYKDEIVRRKEGKKAS